MPLQCHHFFAESSSFISEIFFPETSVYQHQGNIGRTLRFNVVSYLLLKITGGRALFQDLTFGLDETYTLQL